MSGNSRRISRSNSVSSETSLLQLPGGGDGELDKKIRKCSDRITDCVYVLANEPVLGCYRVYEHVHKTSVQLASRNKQLRNLQAQLSGGLFDVEYSIDSVRKMADSVQRFRAGHESLKNALFHKQQLDYELQRKAKLSETKS
jgi:hypothetical protein